MAIILIALQLNWKRGQAICGISGKPKTHTVAMVAMAALMPMSARTKIHAIESFGMWNDGAKRFRRSLVEVLDACGVAGRNFS